MSFTNARNRLAKSILFDLLVRFKLNFCYRCTKVISAISDLTIEHKESWYLSDRPKELFFDLDNIAFSHLKCNCGGREFTLEQRVDISKRNSGEKSNLSKLSDIQRSEIRKRIKNGEVVRQLAREYQVHHTTILNVLKPSLYETFQGV